MVKLFITFYIQNTLNKLKYYLPAAWESPSYLKQWISVARQLRSDVVHHSTQQ